jgi:DNA-binding IclR family transcriptional regulator
MDPRLSTSSADRLLAVLQLFTLDRPEWSVETAAKEIGVSVSTAYRYFRSLGEAGLLDPFTNGTYVLGPAIIAYDRQIRLGDPLIQIARPAMQRLIAQTGSVGVALLCRIYRNRVMCVHQEAKGVPHIAISYERGRPMPMFSGASSKIILANLTSRSARWFFARYPTQIAAAGLGADWETMKANLRRIRMAGVCVTRAEVDKDRVGIAAPVFDATGKVLGSTGLAITQTEATPQFVANAATLVQAVALDIDSGLRALSAESGDAAGEATADP